MTLSVFPSLPGQAWPLTRSPIWKTGIQTTQSGRELRASYMSYPLYKWSMTFDVLRSTVALNEFQQLIGFFNLMSGSATPFVYYDPDDQTATAQVFAAGDGATGQFQVVKNLGNVYVEPCGYIANGAQVFINGTLQVGNYNLNVPYNGWVTFIGSPPGSGVTISWTGTYGYVCRFLSDTYDFTKIYSTIYEAQKIEFMSVKP